MLPKGRHLLGNKNFRQVCQRGIRLPSKNFTLFSGTIAEPSWRVGVVAGRKVGKAVRRNKLKRRLWHAVTPVFLDRGTDHFSKYGYVFVIKRCMLDVSLACLLKEVDEVLLRLKNKRR